MNLRRTRTPRLFLLGSLAAALVALRVTPSVAQCPMPSEQFTPDPAFTSSFMIDRCDFKTTGKNPFFILKPHYQLVLESDEEVAVITVLNETRKVDGVKTRVVEERAFEKDGSELILIERSLNFFAICKQTNSVFYFGEDVEFFDEDGNVIDSAGAWRAGRNGARPGIIMPGTLLVGGAYYEEIAPEDSAIDKGTILAVQEGCSAGDFAFTGQCVTTRGTNDCDTDEDRKVYATGVGVVVDDDLELTCFGYKCTNDDNDSDDSRDSHDDHDSRDSHDHH